MLYAGQTCIVSVKILSKPLYPLLLLLYNYSIIPLKYHFKNLWYYIVVTCIWTSCNCQNQSYKTRKDSISCRRKVSIKMLRVVQVRPVTRGFDASLPHLPNCPLLVQKCTVWQILHTPEKCNKMHLDQLPWFATFKPYSNYTGLFHHTVRGFGQDPSCCLKNGGFITEKGSVNVKNYSHYGITFVN